MNQKNFIVEVVEGTERTFIIRELSNIPNAPAVYRLITDDPQEVAKFFGSDEMFVSLEKS